MTVSRLRTELSEAEFRTFAVYYELKAEKERQEIERAKNQP
jgi:hypothetical protein